MPDGGYTIIGVIGLALALALAIFNGVAKRRESKEARAAHLAEVERMFQARQREKVREIVKGNDLGRMGDLLRGRERLQDKDDHPPKA